MRSRFQEFEGLVDYSRVYEFLERSGYGWVRDTNPRRKHHRFTKPGRPTVTLVIRAHGMVSRDEFERVKAIVSKNATMDD